MNRGSQIAEPYADLIERYVAGADLWFHGDVRALLAVRERQADGLQLNPRSPHLWNQRSTTHLQLGYPELAAADAHKAILLLQSLPSSSTTDLRSRAALNFCESLFLMQSFDECVDNIDHLRTTQLTPWCFQAMLRLRRYVWKCKSKSIPERDRPNHTHGRIRAVDYPWLHSKYGQRNSDTRRDMELELQMLSEEKCTMKQSHVPASMVKSCYGIYAACDIEEGEDIFSEKPALAAANDFSDNARCGFCCILFNDKTLYVDGDEYCSSTCVELANDAFGHHRLRSSSFEDQINTSSTSDDSDDSDSAEDDARSSATSLLLDRGLLDIVQQLKSKPWLHPLATTLMSRLVGHGAAARTLNLSFLDDIQAPDSFLQQLGIDTFADPRYDADVLLTIAGRIEVNSWEDKEVITDEMVAIVAGVNTSYSLLNHSCSPNVHWTWDRSQGEIVLTASEDIREGDELFISYLTEEQLEESREKRCAVLSTWMGQKPHYCTRCFPERHTRTKNNASKAAGGRIEKVRKSAQNMSRINKRKNNVVKTRSHTVDSDEFQALPVDYDSSGEYLPSDEE